MIKSNYIKFISLFIIPFLGLYICGCAAFVVGGAVGLLGGYAISRDTIQGETEKGYDSLWNAASTVLNSMGASEIDDSNRGIVRARIGKSKVYITMEQLTPHSVRLRVKCRKNVMPDLTLSQKLYVRIIEQAE
ncbi:MAG TPA: DUF3568 family protein [Candidatus Omnitrophota bacterium]|nr:DUF3568 family protein [Candidatus Omnitrophota bacterium]